MAEKASADWADEQEQFEKLFTETHHRLLNMLTGMVRDRTRAEDLAAGAFRTAWEKRAQFRGEAALGTWLHAIGINAARNTRREDRPGQHQTLDFLDTSRYAESERVSEALERDELRDRVGRTLDRMPGSSVAFSWTTREGRSLQEIGARERIPVGTVGSRLFTARRFFQEAWEAPVGLSMADDKIRSIADDALKHWRKNSELGAARRCTPTSQQWADFTATAGTTCF